VKRVCIGLLFLVPVLITMPAAAQEPDETLTLSVRKDFGFNMGDRIQGKFTMEVDVADSLARVEFLIDDNVVSVDSEPPFRCSFHTNDYQLGVHRLSAVGYTHLGEQLRSETQTFTFISPDEGWQVFKGIALPIVMLSVALMLVAGLATLLIGRSTAASPIGRYGRAGGAVCPGCGLPYRRHFLSFNLLVGKLERCPHCDKWAIVRRATADELAVAEVALKGDLDQVIPEFTSEEDELRRMIDESRYET
jgi:hypothetical protein